MNRRILELIRRPYARFFTVSDEDATPNIEQQLISESIMWFDAAKGVTLSGSFADIWYDQSPRQMVASRSAGARTNGAMTFEPTGGIGGQPGIYAASNGEYLVSGSWNVSAPDLNIGY